MVFFSLQFFPFFHFAIFIQFLYFSFHLLLIIFSVVLCVYSTIDWIPNSLRLRFSNKFLTHNFPATRHVCTRQRLVINCFHKVLGYALLSTIRRENCMKNVMLERKMCRKVKINTEIWAFVSAREREQRCAVRVGGKFLVASYVDVVELNETFGCDHVIVVHCTSYGWLICKTECVYIQCNLVKGGHWEMILQIDYNYINCSRTLGNWLRYRISVSCWPRNRSDEIKQKKFVVIFHWSNCRLGFFQHKC